MNYNERLNRLEERVRLLTDIKSIRQEIREEFGERIVKVEKDVDDIKGTIANIKAIGWAIVIGVPLLNFIFGLLDRLIERAATNDIP